MNKNTHTKFRIAIAFLTAFVLWTAVICLIDVQAIGPEGSTVGLASLNRFVHDLTGVHMSLYNITDWLIVIPFGFVAGFALLGLIQWIRRKHFRNVDFSLHVLGGFYLAAAASYLLFEVIPINYRPILIDGILEVSYPSSTTLLSLCIMTTAILQLRDRIKNPVLRCCTSLVLTAFTLFMVIGRIFAGVHWITDIIGGILLSTGLVMLYVYFTARSRKD